MKSSSKRQIQRQFDRAHLHYDQHCQIQRQICKDTLSLLNKKKRQFQDIADIACGTGESTLQLINTVKYVNCSAIDISTPCLAIAKQKLPRHIDIRLGDIDFKCYGDNSLDLLFCNMGLHWASNVYHTLHLFYQHMRKNGLLVFNLPIMGNFPEIKDNYKLDMHSSTDITSICKKIGFTDIQSIHKKYKDSAEDSISLLKNLKYTGSNSNRKTKPLFSKSCLQNVFIKNSMELTYVIGIYIMRKPK